MEGEPKVNKVEKSTEIRIDFPPGTSTQEIYDAIEKMIQEEEAKKQGTEQQ